MKSNGWPRQSGSGDKKRPLGWRSYNAQKKGGNARKKRRE
jgi:hypothetical protein